MSTIDEVFATISEGDVSANIDEVLVIDPNTRQISLPGSELIFGVESDTHSERKYFQCPRYVGNDIDLASCFIRVNYRNANGQVDSYLVDDVATSKDTITFSWVLSRKVTQYKGQVRFVVCACRPGETAVEWNTTLATGMVLEGVDPNVDGVAIETSDVVAQLIAMVERQTDAVEVEGTTQIERVAASAEATETAVLAEIEAKGTNTLASIPDDYTTLGNSVEALSRTRAPGIVCEVEGETIVVSDASDMVVQNLRVFGKSTQDGVPTPDAPVEIKSVENPTVTVCGKNLFHLGTFSGTQSSWNEVSFPAGEYTFSAIATSSDTDSTTCLVLVYEDRQKLVEKRFSRGVRESLTFTITGTLTHILLYASNTNNNSVGDTFEFADTMLEVNSEATAYEPYKATQTLNLTHTLPGIPVTSGGNYTDSDGQQWICDEIDFERGVYVRRIYSQTIIGEKIGSVDNGYISYGAYCNVSSDKQVLVNNDVPVVMCDFAIGVPANKRTIPEYAEVYRVYSTTGWHLVIRYPAAEGEKTIDDARKDFAGRKILFALATPIETPLTETEISAFRNLHTNKPHTTILNDKGAHMNAEYVADTKIYIDNKLESLLK